MDTAVDLLQDQRRAPRHLITQRLRAVAAATNEAIGDIVNLSSGGFMLVSKQPIAADERVLLLLELPEAAGGVLRVRLEARCLWCAPSSFSQDYGAGFEITHVSAGGRQRLQQWKSAVTTAATPAS